MSCVLNTVAYCEVTIDVQKFLCPHISLAPATASKLDNPFDSFHDDVWKEDWGSWETSTEQISKNSSDNPQLPNVSQETGSIQEKPTNCWLAECLTAVSPMQDVMAIARASKIVILTGVWEVPEDAEERLVLKQSWRGAFDPSLGAVVCIKLLPVSSLQRSSAGAPDFTAVMVCFGAGSVRFFTLEGALLLQKTFETTGEAVQSVDLRTDGAEEHLALLYRNCIVTVDGNQLSTLLRICINRLAKASAIGEAGYHSSYSPALPFKKWLLPGRGARAVAVSGLARESLYDNLLSTSLSQSSFNRENAIGGINVVGVQLLTAGEDPYIGGVTAKECAAVPHVSEIARQLASAVTSRVLGAASSWLPFMGAKQTDQSKEEKIEPGISINYRWNLWESRRCGLTVSVSPDPRLVVVTDGFGRVVLFDAITGCALRMWKGYRDAAVSWTVSQDDSLPNKQRRTVLLLLFAPKRGLLEVWPAQHGSRLAAFNVPKAAKLVYINYGALGSAGNPAGTATHHPLLLNPDGTLQQLIVPQHILLGGRVGRRVQESQVLRALKAAVKRGSEGEVADLCRQLTSSHGRLQLLSFFAHSSCVFGPSLLRLVLRSYWPLYLPDQPWPEDDEVISKPEEKEECLHDKEAARVQILLRCLKQLLQLYCTIYSLFPKQEHGDDATTHDEHTQELPSTEILLRVASRRLSLSPNRIQHLLHSSEPREKDSSKVTRSQVKFQEEKYSRSCRVNLAWFLRAFELGTSFSRSRTTIHGKTIAAEKVEDDSITQSDSIATPRTPVTIELQDHISSERKFALGRFLFGWRWSSKAAETVHNAIVDSGVNCKALLRLFLHHFSREEASSTFLSDSRTNSDNKQSFSYFYLESIVMMTTVLASLTSVKENEAQCSSDEHSPWWMSVRGRLVSWPCVGRAYLVALTCRTLQREIEDRQRLLGCALSSYASLDGASLSLDQDKSKITLELHDTQEATHDSDSMEVDERHTETQDECPKMDVDATDEGHSIAGVTSSVSIELKSNFNDTTRTSTEIRSLYSQVIDYCKDSSNTDLVVSDEWESSSTECAEWAAFIAQLERMLPLEKLFNCPLQRSVPSVCHELSVKTLLDKGKGGVAELVARWLVQLGFTSDELNALTNRLDEVIQRQKSKMAAVYTENTSKQESEQPFDHDNSFESNVLSSYEDWDDDLSLVYERLGKLSEVFPESLCKESLQTNLCWEAAAAWQRDNKDTELILNAAALAANVPNCHVKHGVSVLVWEKWLGPTFRRVTEALEACASVPTPQHCVASTRMPSHALSSFISAVQLFLLQVLESSVRCQVEKPHISNVDTFWQHMIVFGASEKDNAYRSNNGVEKHGIESPDEGASGKQAFSSIHEPTESQPPVLLHRFLDNRGDGRADLPETNRRPRVCGPKSLLEVAVLQKATSYDLVLIHYQLAMAAQLITSLEMNGFRPLHLFSDRCRAVLHKSLHVQWSQGAVAEEAAAVTNQRIKFLSNAISCAVASLPDQATWQEFQNCGTSAVIELGNLWGLNIDHLYRYQVIELYSYGQDGFAQDSIRLVSNTRQLAQNLLLLAGCRYKYLIDCSRRPAQLTVSLGATHAHWVKSLNADQLKNPSVSGDSNLELVHTVLRLLPRESPDYSKADTLLYAFKAVEEAGYT